MPHDPHILLVEDEAPKRKHIFELLKVLAPQVRLSSARSVNSALDVLEREPVDLLVLDMSLPTFDVGDREKGGRPQGFGGTEILRHISMAEIKCHTIIITGYEGFKKETGETVDLAQLRAELMIEFRDSLRAVLYYNSTYDEWKTVLRETLVDFRLSGDQE